VEIRDLKALWRWLLFKCYCDGRCREEDIGDCFSSVVMMRYWFIPKPSIVRRFCVSSFLATLSIVCPCSSSETNYNREIQRICDTSKVLVYISHGRILLLDLTASETLELKDHPSVESRRDSSANRDPYTLNVSATRRRFVSTFRRILLAHRPLGLFENTGILHL